MSINITRISKIMDSLLEDPLDQALWEKKLIDLAAAFGARGLNVIPFTDATNMSVIYTPSLAKGFEEYFDDGWHNKDWHAKALPFLSRTGVVRDVQYTTRDEFERNQFHRFARKHGVGHSAFLEWHMSAEDRLVLAIHRHAGDDAFTNEEEDLLHAIRRRFQDLGFFMHHLSSSKLRGTAEGLDVVKAPALFFDRFYKVIHVNEAAQALLGDDLKVLNGDLLAARAEDTNKIRLQMRQSAAPLLLKLNTLLEPIRIERKDEPPLALRIQRLGGNLPSIFCAAVGVCLLSYEVVPKLRDGSALIARYGLSVQETAIALQLYDGLSAREIADKTSRSYETVRTHIKTLLQKTGTKRQGELLALIGKLQSMD
ncbi:helix-turn-helix transcriptional regulator [Ochrobactrum chromiisoli]|uniref:LuxR C-terminal-related transcriptional regulator n=1 Tax=Ochrobactrum chromiisoli TaxID=2993941 RepID=A0ABT3QP60_9HYPH|nr:LuxR C-terminal-related transcriptional regulator [Ochrobactrum chromiisoli]MCX2697403.1 LuxR C-terminal-related transcriptional regulator [Ochrobactrum chromiisoli]